MSRQEEEKHPDLLVMKYNVRIQIRRKWSTEIELSKKWGHTYDGSKGVKCRGMLCFLFIRFEQDEPT